MLAASYLLVGYLTLKTQELDRTAGLSDARSHEAQRERRLRLALDHVLESLNTELLLHAIVREAASLLQAERAMVVVDPPTHDAPRRYVGNARKREVLVEQSPLAPEVHSLLARDASITSIARADGNDTIARYALESLGVKLAVMTVLRSGDCELPLLIMSEDAQWDQQDARLLKSFAEECETALAQSHLFMRIAEQADEIAEQHETSVKRINVIRDLVYALAHDLRTPLSAANTTMQQALRGEYGALPAAYHDVLLTSVRSNQELQRMVETLLLVARYESGESSQVREELDLGQIAREAVAELESTARDRNVTLSALVEPSIVFGDPSELRRVALNLLANALAASSSHATITVKMLHDSQRTHLIVEDEGPGIPLADRATLFARFAGNARKRGAGTGLGLYIVRLIARKHGGDASYEPLERGSRFTVSLPRGAPP